MKTSLTAVIVIIAWLVTAAVGIWEIILVRQLFFRLMAHFTTAGDTGYDLFLQAQQAGASSILLVIVLAVLWIVAFIGGAEYHYRHFGRPDSWRLFSRIAAAELAILLLAWFI